MQMPQLRALPDAGGLALFAATRGAAMLQDNSTPMGGAMDFGARIDQLTAAVNALNKKIDEL